MNPTNIFQARDPEYGKRSKQCCSRNLICTSSSRELRKRGVLVAYKVLWSASAVATIYEETQTRRGAWFFIGSHMRHGDHTTFYMQGSSEALADSDVVDAERVMVAEGTPNYSLFIRVTGCSLLHSEAASLNSIMILQRQSS